MTKYHLLGPVKSVFTNHSEERFQYRSADFFLYIEVFESNTTSDWLNRTV